jgi:two-component system CheB/CheR fusion protein
MPKQPSKGRDHVNEKASPKSPAARENPPNSHSGGTFPIVGIGGSAGGLEAMTALLKALPVDLGMTYVFIPHLDPNRESAFTEILSRATTMPVAEITDRIPVQPDHVYVIPPSFDALLDHQSLHLRKRDPGRSSSVSVDVFLRSLAADMGKNAIGVLLSGTGSDGSIGLASIKAEGGITFAQSSATAKYDGMPSSAISAGSVDFVLSPEEIANELARVRHHPYVASDEPDDLIAAGRDAQFAQVFRLLRRLTRVDFSDYKQPTIHRRVRRRMVLLKIEHLEEYIALLQQNRQELTALYHDLLINVTAFFRNPDAFEGLRTVVYPAILARHKGQSGSIRIWVPGCSTGEEAYSHAISIVEYLVEQRVEIPIQVFGTDLSESAISRARAGLYKENIEADVSPIRLRRFFHKSELGYQISKTVRDLCVFSTQNVFNDPPFSRMDLVSCRNVMIYLGQSLQKRVIPIFHYALNPDGFLMIGNTEGLLGAGAELFEVVDKKQKIYRKKLVPTPITFGFSVGPRDYHFEESERNVPNRKTPEPPRAPVDLQREADRLLLTRYAPPSVIVNDVLEIVQTKGHTGTFLELPSGKASLNILKMARPGLLVELQNTLEKARQSGTEAVTNNIRVEGNGNSLTLRVTPFKTPVQDQNSYLLVFESERDHAPRSFTAISSPEPLANQERLDKDQLIAQLRQELAATKEYLQAIIESQEATNEELQSANEEIQSGNEELQSTNEELQTSKEELESANEELHTVNEEMQHRNEQLSQLNNDLTNLLNSVNLPLVMVGSDLSVRRFTPQAAHVLGLVSSDVGRPIPRLKLKIEVENLEQAMLEVLQDVQPRHYRVKDSEGNWCSFRLAPYRTLDNRIDGVVLSIVTIDAPEK